MIPKNLFLLFFLCASLSSLVGMKNVKKVKFGKNIFSYDRITHEINHFNKHRSIDSWFLKDGKLWEKRITHNRKYDILPVIITSNGKWVAQKLTRWGKIRKFLGMSLEYRNQVQVPPTGYFSTYLCGQKKIYPKRSQFPNVYAR